MSLKRHTRAVAVALGLVLLCVATTPAKADSVAYDIGGTFRKGSLSQYFGGVVDWNAKTNQVTSYTLTLGTSTFTCSGFCTFVFKNFNGEILMGSFNPKDTDFTLAGWGSGGPFVMKLKDMAWSPYVSTPDAPATAELFCVLALFGLMIPCARTFRRQS